LPEVQNLLALAATAEPLDPLTPIPRLRAACDAGVIAQHDRVRQYGELPRVVDLHAGDVPVRLYVPSQAANLPVHVHLHGGGWWMGSVETVDPMARELAHRSGLAVVSVDYRLAPEHPFPAGLDDVCTVLDWLATAPKELGFAPTSISLGGESAGANLAAVACFRIREQGGPPLVAQWLDILPADLTTPDDEALRDYGTGFGLEMSQVPVLLAWYGADAHDPLVSPALASDLTDLPPAIITTAECDPLRDQGERYAAALAAAGNQVYVSRALGHIHASSWLTGLTPGTAQWYDDVVAVLVAHHAEGASSLAAPALTRPRRS
jgi:acetyl esterase